MKKALPILFITVLIVFLTGCKSNENVPMSNDTGSVTVESTEPEEREETVTISLYRVCSTGNPEWNEVKEIEEAINEYIEDKINVKIVLYDVAGNEYPTEVSRALNNNEVDLLWTASWQAAIGTKELYTTGTIRDITDFLEGTVLYSSMTPDIWNASKYDGRNYFVPVYKDCVEGYDLMIRKELAEKYNWDMSTVGRLENLEKILADCVNEGLKYPYLTRRTAMFNRWYIDDFDFFTGDANSSWIAVNRETDEVVDTVSSWQYLEYCKLLASWGDKGYMSRTEIEDDTTEASVKTKDWGVTWWTDVPNNNEASARNGQDVLVVPLTDRYIHTDSTLGSCYAVSSACSDEKTRACIDFLGLLYTDKTLADLYTYGICGVDYTYDSDGYVERTGDSSFFHSMWESASATVVTAESASPYTPEMYIDFNESALTSCANGFRFNLQPVEAEFMACQSVFSTYGIELENGMIPEAEVEEKIAEYRKELDAVGYQAVLEEAQRQYTSWKAAK